MFYNFTLEIDLSGLQISENFSLLLLELHQHLLLPAKTNINKIIIFVDNNSLFRLSFLFVYLTILQLLK